MYLEAEDTLQQGEAWILLRTKVKDAVIWPRCSLVIRGLYTAQESREQSIVRPSESATL